MNTSLTRHSGHTLAIIASALLLTMSVLVAGIVSLSLFYHFAYHQPYDYLLHNSVLPAVAMLVWLLTVGGLAAAIVAAVVYNYRARWFWRCLLVAAVLMLCAPPIHFVIGIISLIVLIASRRAFPEGSEPVVPAI